MGRKTVTIRDVARHAGVGISTVSYVLNGDEQHVSATTREQILAAVRELKYRPNAIARSMVKRKTGTVGLIISELSNALFVPITDGVEQVLSTEGYHIVLARAESAEAETNAIELLRSQQVDGIIFMSLSVRRPADPLSLLEAEEVPFVVINRDLNPGQFCQIMLDDRGAGRQATEHLISLGYDSIGTITGIRETRPGYEPRRSAVERHAGWEHALTRRGLLIQDAWIVPGWYTYQGGYEAIHELARRSALPRALMIANDMMAIGALRALAELQIRVPHDLAIATIGDPPYAAYTVPPLTTLALPIEEAGRLAARILIEWIQGKPPESKGPIVLPFDLKVRESCGARKLE
jgi:LacI family transcriptional regulator